MKTITAKSVEQVKEWIATNRHHRAAWLTKDKRHPRTGKEETCYFEIANYEQRMFIPVAISKQCFLTPYNAPEGFMYRWDEIAEKIAPFIGKYVTTSVNTFELTEKNEISTACGIRQGILHEVDYYRVNEDNEPSVPFYVIKGQKGYYAMRADDINDTFVVVEDRFLFGDVVTHIVNYRKKHNIDLGVLNDHSNASETGGAQVSNSKT